MQLLIDGYNVVAPVSAPSRRSGHAVDPNWLQRERSLLIKRLIRHLPQELRSQTCVVFDAANPPRDQPSTYQHDGIEVRFAVEHAEADDLIEELIASHSSPKQLMVVSSDHRVRNAASRRGCQTFDSQNWLDLLLDGKLQIQISSKQETGRGREADEQEKPLSEIDPSEVDQWMQDFGFGP